MVFVTGDMHLTHDIGKFRIENFPEQKKLTKDDYVIICGDFGGVWDGGPDEEYWVKWLSHKKYTTLWVDGNHENFDRLARFPVTRWKGGRVQVIADSVIHLMRGELYEIEGKTFFTMGGASSHDRMFRKEGISWWQAEIPSDEELSHGFDTLDAVGNRVDFMLSHCASNRIMRQVAPHYGVDKLTTYFEVLEDRVDYGHWYFGHYHDDLALDAKHTLLYREIRRIL